MPPSTPRPRALPILPPLERLTYSIHSSSGHTADFAAHKILVDHPNDQDSRWTGATGGPTDGDDKKVILPKDKEGRALRRDVQFVTLELEKPALVHKIGFGKYMKGHSCNLKKLSVYGGMSPNKRYMQLLFHGGLRNDGEKELFDLAISEPSTKFEDPVLLPIKYIRIDAIEAHSMNYNVSIWHIWLEGCTSPEVVAPVQEAFEQYRNLSTSHLILAHLRRSYLLPAFATLLSTLPPKTSSTFEHPLISSLHTSLVLDGLFTGPSGVETLFEDALSQNLLREWGPDGSKGKSVARWERLDGRDGSEIPGPRGGQQMVRVGRKIILHGGWDGQKDLDDLWECDLPRSASDGDGGVGKWRCLDRGLSWEIETGVSERRKRPRGRSCHQLAVDESEGWVYLLGGHGPSDDSLSEPLLPSAPIPISLGNGRTNGNGNGTAGVPMDVEGDSSENSYGVEKVPNPLANDFWRYKAVGVGQGSWELLSEDVAAEGGPNLLFDHQMVVHSDTKMIFVFGGKIVQYPPPKESANVPGSGLFAYDISKKVWYSLTDPSAKDESSSERLLSRVGHSMVLDPTTSTLFIYAGQRKETYISELWAVKLASASNSSTLSAATSVEHPEIEEDEDDEEEEEMIDDEASNTAPATRHWRAGAAVPSVPPTIVSITQIAKNSTRSTQSALLMRDDGPPPGFTQRLTIDSTSGEWTLLTGLAADKKTEAPMADVWRRTKDGHWAQVEVRGDRPEPRFAAQVVYDPLRKEHYLMGGNPKDPDDDHRRLGDFWRLKIVKSSPEEALRKAKFLIRKQKFNEMCQTQPTLSALTYLQTTLSSVVDHTDEAEASAFRSCMASLLAAPAKNNYDESMDEDDDEDGEERQPQEKPTELTSELYAQRHALFEVLLNFFPDGETQPKDDLRDMATRRWDQN